MSEAKTPPKAPKQSDTEVDQLLREGLAAIKMRDKASARAKLQEVVERDQNNEKGWFYLASVVETNDERRVCLGNVVVINPKNERAKVMLDQLSGNPNAGLIIGDPVLEGNRGSPLSKLSGRQRVLVGVIVLLLVLVVGIFVLSGVSGGAPPATPTVASIAGVQSATVPSTSAGVLPVAGTSAATSGPTVTLPPVPPTLPPTWTPRPSETAAGQAGTALPPPPEGLTGRLVLISGSIFTTDRSLPIFVSDPYGKKLDPVSQSDVGDYGILSPDGQRLIFSRFLASTESHQLRTSFSNGTRATELSTLWGNTPPLANAMMPSLSRNGAVMAFVATSLTENETTPAIWVVSAKVLPPLGSADTAPTTSAATESAAGGPAKPPTVAPTAPPSAPAQTPTTSGAITQVKRITVKDNGINSWPAVSPDGTKIVFASDSQPQGTDGTDLYVMGSNGGTPKKLTDDLTANTEAAPAWSSDGKRIAYQVTPQGATNSDIWVMNADGSNKTALVTGLGDNIRPHWSPDGKFIAFSSTRNGKWEVYIVDVSSKAVYQVTQTTVSTICTDWGPK